ncbi:hypothetical protein [Nocardia niwae]|uniref:GNAT family N-acetyltransferase n=1 Tax=Nocardia niwae TaxID=626084 RepID=A0ABV2X926_9NOCA|nr:hypothetical protein [Nocardia niwae]
MGAEDVHMVTSPHEVLDALSIPYARWCIEDWVSEGQLYKSGAAPFLTGIDFDPVAGTQIRIVRFGTAPTPVEMRATLDWAIATCGEDMFSIDAPGAADLRDMRCSQIYVERMITHDGDGDIRRTTLAEAPDWVRSNLETSLRNGAAARGLVFAEAALANYLGDLFGNPNFFVSHSTTRTLAAACLLVEDDWDGRQRLELFDLVGTDTRYAESLLASTARMEGFDRIRGTVTMGSDTRGPKVWTALRARGWSRVGSQITASRQDLGMSSN